MSLPNFFPTSSIFFIRTLNFVVVCVLVFYISGCASSTPKSSAPIPQALAQPCPKLATLQGATGADVLRWSADTVRKYQLCAAQVEGLQAAWPE